MKLFDGHLHFKNDWSSYDIDCSEGNVIFNSVDEYIKYADFVPEGFSISLIFDYSNNEDFIRKQCSLNRISALKIHSRIQKLTEYDTPLLIEKLYSLNTNIPIIYDAFYYGSDLSIQPSLKSLISLSKSFPNSQFVVAHAGGHHVLDYFYHLRDLQNIVYDISLSAYYLRGTSAFLDLKKLLQYTDRKKIVFGTDYPYVLPSEQLSACRELLDEIGFSAKEMEMFYFSNAKKIFTNNVL